MCKYSWRCAIYQMWCWLFNDLEPFFITYFIIQSQNCVPRRHTLLFQGLVHGCTGEQRGSCLSTTNTSLFLMFTLASEKGTILLWGWKKWWWSIETLSSCQDATILCCVDACHSVEKSQLNQKNIITEAGLYTKHLSAKLENLHYISSKIFNKSVIKKNTFYV